MDYVLEGIDAGELVQKLKLTIPVTNLNLITQLCHLLDTLLLDSGHYTDPNVSSAFRALSPEGRSVLYVTSSKIQSTTTSINVGVS